MGKALAPVARATQENIMKQYTDQQLRDAAALHQSMSTDPTMVFYAVCKDILGYTPLGQLLPDGMDEFDEFTRRYRSAVGPV